ncbi:MAG: translation elongation factor Ts [Defluviitaleaceae bacterium]|nr:translation elongation factor Ts [Defluviitaleaceae bacterium]
MAVTAAMVKELRELSGAGMSACKDALVEANGDIEQASKILREKGLAAAAKKAGRVAAEGLVQAYLTDDRKSGAVVEVNSETDFVAKNQDFIDYVNKVAELALKSNAEDIEAFMSEKWPTGETVQEVLTQKIATIGENIGIRRFTRYAACDNGTIVHYTHGGGRVVVMMELESDTSNDELIEAGRNLCMQIAAMSPLFVAKEDVSEDFIAKEKEILLQQAINEGRPANVAEKVVEGRLKKNLVSLCLLEQEYVKDGDMTCAKYLESVSASIGSKINVRRFVRYETGEGIEKKEENFAEEVSKAMGG